jgi:hypothetical protein
LLDVSVVTIGSAWEKRFDIDSARIARVPARIRVDDLQNFKATRFIKAPGGLIAN